jgi:hypothetical protein
MVWVPPNAGKPRNETPTTFDMPKNPNDDPMAGRNLNHWAFKDRSGNMMMFNHQRGYENVTIEHRTGAKMQLMPDGSVYIQAQKGQYTMTFGENRMKITGSHDIVVDGAASLKVNGDYNVTVGKDFNLSTSGDFNINALNVRMKAGCFDVAAKNITAVSEGGISLAAKGAATFLSEDGGMTIGSNKNSVAIGAGKKMALYARTGELMLKSLTKIGATAGAGIQLQSGGYLNAQTVGALNMQSGATASIASTGTMAIKSAGQASISATTLGVNGPVRVAINSGVEVPPTPVAVDPSVDPDVGFLQLPTKPVPCGDPTTAIAALSGAAAPAGTAAAAAPAPAPSSSSSGTTSV